MHPIKFHSSKTYILIVVSSYQELLRNGHTTSQQVQLLIELPFNALIVTYSRV
jgi:hypothetical protein